VHATGAHAAGPVAFRRITDAILAGTIAVQAGRHVHGKLVITPGTTRGRASTSLM
jgi:hypothetical protein